MLKRIGGAANSLLILAAALVLHACSKDAETPPVGPEPPAPVIPVLTPGTAATFDAALNSTLDVAPFVTVKDPNNNPLPNIWIKWTTTVGKVEVDSSLTDANGRASAGKWTVGTVSGVQTVTARTGTVSVVAMTAKVAPGPLVGLVNASTGLTGIVGGNVGAPASVKAVDSFGNGIPAISLQFAMWAGDGTITGATQTTNENGIATVGSWKLGPKAGIQAIRADDHRTGVNVIVNATALPAPASQIVVIDGNAQTGQTNKRLCMSPVVAVRDQYGNGIGQVPIVFTPGANSGTVIDGSVTSIANTGWATVGAWMLATGATQTLTVTSPVMPGVSATFTATLVPSTAYTVCARYLGDGGTPRQRQAVTTAIERWQRVITAHVQTSPIVENANRCFAGQPALNESVEDLLVFVQITNIDGPGNVVAKAGPCSVHLPSTLTQMGLLQLDSTDMQLLLGQGTLDNMVTHEFGHVLGFGTLWYSRGLLGGTGADPVFTGARARTEFTQLFSSYPATPVPIENVGDIGTRDSHWRQSVFRNELMQGFSSTNMPMSRVTVGSLADLGYAVDMTQADPFVFTTALRSSVFAGVQLANDVLETEVWGVEKNGNRVKMTRVKNPFR